MHISIANILKMVTARANINITIKISDTSIFDWLVYFSHYPILKVKVKVMHISIANISEESSTLFSHIDGEY